MKKSKNFKIQLDNDLYKDLLKTKISEKIKEYFGEVDPDYLEEFSKIIEKDLEYDLAKLKDTEDYNMDVVSSYIDQTLMKFMEAGQSKISNTDAMLFEVKNQVSKSRDNKVLKDFKEAKRSHKEAELFPFSTVVADELRGHFLLKTNSSDSYKSLMKRIDDKIKNYLAPRDWAKIKRAIEKAQERIFKEKLLFLNPLEGREQGKLRTLSEEEKNQWGMNLKENIYIDERQDNHDFVAMKEFCLILEGEDVHNFTIAPGFLAKYLPEIKKELRCDALIFHVEDNKLKQIIPQKHEVDINGYGVTDAAFIFTMWRVKSGEDHMELPYNQKFYVLVDGAVGGPAPDKNSLGYKELSHNTQVIPAAEVFLYYENDMNFLKGTRLYFTPYKPSMLHPYHQHGSVVFGSNDMSFHSCCNNRDLNLWNDKTLSEAERQDYYSYFRNRWIDEINNSKGDCQYEDSLIAMYIHEMDNEEYKKEGFTKLTKLKDKKGIELFKQFLQSNLEESKFMKKNFKIKYNIKHFHDKYKMYPEFDTMYGTLVSNTFPLSKRFILSSYRRDNTLGIHVKNSTYSKLSKELKTKNNLNFISNVKIDKKKKS